jgi:hypothetical protein
MVCITAVIFYILSKVAIVVHTSYFSIEDLSYLFVYLNR